MRCVCMPLLCGLPQRFGAAELDTRVKARVYPGRARFSTRVSAEGTGLAPEWNDGFQLVCPVGLRAADYVPCVSFR
jgi:hypothetical protein